MTLRPARALAAVVVAVVALALVLTATLTTAAAAPQQAPTTTGPTTTGPSTTGPTTTSGEVDTGTVPGAEDGTGTALLIGAAFIGLIAAGAVVAKVWPRPVHEPCEPGEPDIEPSPRQPIVFDQDQTDGTGWPLPSTADRPSTRSEPGEQRSREA